ncbi:3-methyl-2-oxobutanoate hydroxymethyltransferase [Puniceicoccaceae bacterium K14]|nr:3-methyl-2-oxobutanoate hydroxymethyltransferase [Puniceicoccaceae bacterium K14]
MKAIPDFQKWRASERKISMLTCYDAATARILENTSVDCILVGDSCAMVVHGYDSTIHATVEMLATHTAAVRRGAPTKPIVVDMPFLSYRKGLENSIQAVATLMRAGANAVKLERCRGNLELIEHIVDGGVPVMGHLGLTPQAVNELGGYKLQGRGEHEAERLIAEAKELEDAGCFSIVLECIPAGLAKAVTEELAIPTIGIGCGPDTSGQVLVVNDMLGLDTSFKPKFVRHYARLESVVDKAVSSYCEDVVDGVFPAEGEFWD